MARYEGDLTLGSTAPRQRGSSEHERRDQILKAAGEHFRHYGYNKTTVADLAKAIGLSTAYIYKFFESKQAIGQAICGMTLGQIIAELRVTAQENLSATDRLRLLFQRTAQLSEALFFDERQLHDLAATACVERWQSVSDHEAALSDIIREIVAQGRERGEFERKTPTDEVCRAISQTLRPFWNPIFLQYNLDDLNENALCVGNLVQRSLAP